MAGIIRNIRRAKEWFSGSSKLPNGKSRRFLAYSPQAKAFVKENSGILIKVHGMINENLVTLIKGKPAINKELGIRIEKASTGSSKGKSGAFTARVTIGEKAFFLKIVNARIARGIVSASGIAERLLRDNGRQMFGVKVQQIKPLIVYENWMKNRTFVVTNFFEAHDVEQVSEMKDPVIKRKAKSIIKELRLDTEEHGGHALDIWPDNAFYNAKTNTILLFDFY